MATLGDKRMEMLEASNMKMSEILHELQMNVQKLTLLLETVVKHNEQVDDALKANQEHISHIAADVAELKNAEKTRNEASQAQRDTIVHKKALLYTVAASIGSAIAGAGVSAWITHLLHP